MTGTIHCLCELPPGIAKYPGLIAKRRQRYELFMYSTSNINTLADVSSKKGQNKTCILNLILTLFYTCEYEIPFRLVMVFYHADYPLIV
jgi:hypothetical protein